MAEYRTYICDVCKEHNAKRFTFPCVDRKQRSVAEESSLDLEIEGHVDLCFKHTDRIFEALLQRLPGMAEQRALWLAFGGQPR